MNGIVAIYLAEVNKHHITFISSLKKIFNFKFKKNNYFIWYLKKTYQLLSMKVHTWISLEIYWSRIFTTWSILLLIIQSIKFLCINQMICLLLYINRYSYYR